MSNNSPIHHMSYSPPPLPFSCFTFHASGLDGNRLPNSNNTNSNNTTTSLSPGIDFLFRYVM